MILASGHSLGKIAWIMISWGRSVHCTAMASVSSALASCTYVLSCAGAQQVTLETALRTSVRAPSLKSLQQG